MGILEDPAETQDRCGTRMDTRVQWQPRIQSHILVTQSHFCVHHPEQLLGLRLSIPGPFPGLSPAEGFEPSQPHGAVFSVTPHFPAPLLALPPAAPQLHPRFAGSSCQQRKMENPGERMSLEGAGEAGERWSSGILSHGAQPHAGVRRAPGELQGWRIRGAAALPGLGYAMPPSPQARCQRKAETR